MKAHKQLYHEDSADIIDSEDENEEIEEEEDDEDSSELINLDDLGVNDRSMLSTQKNKDNSQNFGIPIESKQFITNSQKFDIKDLEKSNNFITTKIDEHKDTKDPKKIDPTEGLSRDELVNILMNSDKVYQDEKKSLNKKPSTGTISTNNSKKKQVINYQIQDADTINEPEYTNDFSVAYLKVLNNMMKNPNSVENQDLMKIFTSDKVDFSKLEAHQRDRIEEKIEKFLERKNRNLEVIQERVNEEFDKAHTFAPETNNKNGEKRNFEDFLSDQMNFAKKQYEKIQSLKTEIERKNQLEKCPKISDKSKKIFEDKLNTGVPVFTRLYNQKDKTKDELSKNSKKEQNLKPVDEIRINNLYADHFKRQERLDDLTKKYEGHEMEKHIKINSLGSSNKVLLKKFVKQYKIEVSSLEKLNSISQNILSFNELQQLLINLNFLSLKKEQSNDSIYQNKLTVEEKLLQEIYNDMKYSDGNINSDFLFIFLLSILNLYETYLLKIYQLNSKDLDLNILSEDKSDLDQKSGLTDSSKRLSKDSSTYTLHDQKKEMKKQILLNINNQMMNRIKKYNKYGGVDEDGNYLIPLALSKVIFKEFGLLYLNWSNIAFSGKNKKKINQETMFKPKINENSVKMSNNYRQKVKIEADRIIESNKHEKEKLKQQNSLKNYSGKNIISVNEYYGEDNQNPAKNLNYFDMILIKKKKQENLALRLKEENEKKELENCTFKPKINPYSADPHIQKLTNSQSRTDQLYQKGLSQIAIKKDKTKEEIELEKYAKECTFKPNIEKEYNLGSTNSNYENESNLKQIEKFNERMRQGRIEREIKENAHRRFEIKSPERVEQKINYVSKLNPSNSNYSQSYKGKYQDNDYEKRNYGSKSPQRDSLITNPSQTSLNSNNLGPVPKVFTKDAQEKMRDYLNQADPSKKDKMPLLVIDVNIKPGVKKQIYVFEGNNSEELSEKFARENQLGEEVRKKLKKLVESHMEKLLVKIEEENSVFSTPKNSL